MDGITITHSYFVGHVRERDTGRQTEGSLPDLTWAGLSGSVILPWGLLRGPHRCVVLCHPFGLGFTFVSTSSIFPSVCTLAWPFSFRSLAGPRKRAAGTSPGLNPPRGKEGLVGANGSCRACLLRAWLPMCLWYYFSLLARPPMSLIEICSPPPGPAPECHCG